LGGKGEYAIITASLTAGNMVAWQKAIDAYNKEKFPDLKMVALRPCDDKQKQAFDEANNILNAHKTCKLIMAICSPAVPGAAEAVEQSGRSDVKVIGLGLPNDNKVFVKKGITEAVVLWKTADLGYLAVQAAVAVHKGTLKAAMKDDFAGVAHDPVLRLYDRKEMSDEDMVAYLAHCLTDIPSKRPSIETLMHSFLPYEHIDHTHADYALWFAALEGGRKYAEDLFQDELVWVDYHRPGFHLAKTVSEAVKKNAKAKCVILAKHGLLTWGKTSKECYHSTLSVLQKFDAAVQKKLASTKVFGGARAETLTP